MPEKKEKDKKETAKATLDLGWAPILIMVWFILFVGKSCKGAEEAACAEHCRNMVKESVAGELKPYRGFHEKAMCLCYLPKGAPVEIFLPGALVTKHEGCCQ